MGAIKLLRICLVSLLLIVSGFSYGACEITLRWDDDPPFFMESAEGVVGIDADISREAIRRLGCGLKLVKLPWARALFDLREGRLDMVSGAYRTPKRERYAHYANVVRFVSPNVLFTRVQDHARVDNNSLAETLDAGIRLGMQIDVSYGDEADVLKNNPAYADSFQYVSRRESLWLMLARERVDGVIADTLTGLYEVRELGLSEEIRPTSLVVSNKPAFFIFSKKTISPDLVARFDHALQSMLDDGTFREIISNYVCAPTPEGITDRQQDQQWCQ